MRPNREELVNLAVAEHIIGFRVERVTPAWYGREVWCFYGPDDPLMTYSWDANACNACMFRNGLNDTAGTARPLPGYAYTLAEAWEVVARIRKRGKLEAFRCGLPDIWTMTEEEAALAICTAALEAVGVVV